MCIRSSFSFFFVLPDLQFLIRSFSLFHHALTHSHTHTHSLTHTHSHTLVVGLHVWVIDKFLNGIYGLYKMVLNHISETLEEMRQRVPSLEVVGFSGYTVSYDGVSLFFNKLNCMERYNYMRGEAFCYAR